MLLLVLQEVVLVANVVAESVLQKIVLDRKWFEFQRKEISRVLWVFVRSELEHVDFINSLLHHVPTGEEMFESERGGCFVFHFAGHILALSENKR